MTSATNVPGSNTSVRTLTPERAAKLELDQLLMAHRNSRPGLIGFPIIGVTICGVLLQWVPIGALSMWVIACIGGVVAIYLVQRQFHNHKRDIAETHRWLWILSATHLAFALIWTAPVLLFWPYCDDLGRMFLILVYACNMAGGAALNSPFARYGMINIATSAFVIVVPPAVEGTAFYAGLALLAAFYSAFIAHMARNVYVTARDLLLIRDDKNELIEQLAAAKIESDKARRRAEAASQAKSEFLANMSHELRTPLNAILGFSEIMKGEVFGSLGSPQYIEYAEHIHGSGQHLLGLINDVLDLARIEAGRFVIRPVEINVREAAAGALKLFEVRAAQANIRLTLEIEPRLPLLLADERAIRQVLLNLVSNAVKFTPGGGTVSFFARNSALGGMEVGVSDTGAGIDPADLDRVFEAFGQGRHDIAVSEKGTGLGLPIVRGLVESHGGKVSLASELGKGTTVTCYFPRERLTAPQPKRLATVF